VSNIFYDYLIPAVNVDENTDVQSRIVASIKEVPQNPYYIQNLSDFGFKHYVLELTTKSSLVHHDEEGESFLDDNEFEGLDCSNGSFPLTFFYSGPCEPSEEVFAQHIKRECRSALRAVKGNSQIISPVEGHLTPYWEGIEMTNVYDYMRDHSLLYDKTDTFLRDYNFWMNRLYATLKWLAYMRGDSEWQGGYVAIGDLLYDFLSMGDYRDYFIGQYLCR
jgi:hypothetical protein